MKFFVTCDANIESGLNEVLNDMELAEYFKDRQYDDSAIEMAVILMCRHPRWNFKQRIRFVKKDNCLYMDIMLDLPIMARADLSARKRIVAEKMSTEVPQIVAKYKFKDFDLKRFSSELRKWFEQNQWMEPSDDYV